MAHQVVVAAVSVTRPGQAADATEDTIVHKGALLPDWVDDYTRFVLTTTGMARFVDDEVAKAMRVEEAAPPQEPVRLQEHPPLTSPAAVAERGTAAGEAAARLAAEAGGKSAARPAQNAPKGEWVDHAVAKGADRARAEAATKDDLVKTADGDYAARFGGEA
jgi:hypothetical protein